ncbi:MAG: CARDB domain-containing protein [Bacteroidales bacterium]|nr:CARDB domain-containing protein [Bacteroidales bacterium]
MKLLIHTNNKLNYSGVKDEFRNTKYKSDRINFLRIAAFALLIWLPVVASAQLTLPAIPSNASLAKRFELSTEMIFRVKAGNTFLPSGALIAYINGEIRGAQTASVLYPPTGVNVYKVLVFDSKSSGDTITFKYYDTFSSKIYDITEKIEFIPNLVPDYANPTILTAYCKPIDKVTGLIPVNATENLNATLDLYWQPSPNTTSYNLYFWEDGTTMPATPTNANISGTTFRLYNLKYGQIYRWKIGSINDCSSAESAIQTLKTRLLPDLTVTSVTAPANIESGSNLNVSFSVKNAGAGNTAGLQWYDAVYASTDQTWSNDDILLSTKTNVTQLEPDSTYTQSASISLPIDFTGNYYFLVKTDNTNSVVEFSEINNLGKTAAVSHITLKSLPDIRVKDIAAEKVNVNPGDSITISWKVENIGGVATAGGWVERITIVPVTGLNLSIDPNTEYTLPLPAGTTINRSRKIKMPDILRFSGDAHIQAELIPYADLIEYAANKANNIALSAGKITAGNILTLDIQETSLLENLSSPLRCIATRSGDYSANLIVSLSASVAGQVTIPATVTIPANQSSVVFNLNTINNALIDGQRTVWITATAAQYSNSAKTITILDDEIPSLTAVLNKTTATEGDTITLTVSRNLVTNQPLTVSLTTNKPSQWTFPTSFVILANTASAKVSINITNDNVPELTNDAIIYASSAGITTGTVTASIVDNDVPQVSLELLSDTVSESAGVYATWGLLKRISGDGIITVNLTSSLPGALFFPASLTLPKGAQEQKFNIGVVDNGDVDGYRKVILSGSVYISSCNCGTSAENGGIVSANLIIADNDGPTLSLAINPVSLPEGKLNAGTLTITRNTPTNNALLVNISHNDPTEVSIQTTATILAGQKSVQVPINSINDNIEDGTQMVSIQSSAPTFSSGFGYVFVTDLNKPDLVITKIAVSDSTPATNDVIEISGTAGNIGFSTAPSAMKIAFYCSKDKTLDVNDIVLGEYEFPSPISQAATAIFTKAVIIPAQTGDFYILAKINPTESLTELVYFNNVSDAVGITIAPEYTATAITDNAIYLPKTTVPIHGSAINSKNTPVADVDVDIYIITAGIRRELKAKTNSLGQYSVDFVPSIFESGHYSIGACYPKQNLSAEQDKFDIPGLIRESNSNIVWDMKLGQLITGKIALKNTSEAVLKHIVILADNLPAGCELKFDTIAVLSANQTKEFNFTLQATELTKGSNYEKINFHVQSAEGITIDFPAYYYCQALQAQLKSDPVSINTTMTKGKPRLYEFHIFNNGAGETGKVTISLPNVSWMNLISPDTLTNISPQDTVTVIVNLAPTADVPLNTPISGNITANCVNGNGVQIPYRFEVVSEEKGGLKVDVIDEYTYFTEDKPHVKNAHVVVRHPFSGKIMADGFTDANGIFAVDSLPEGSYKMNVEADKHEGFQTTITIDPGRINEQTVFISFQAITYTWEVVPTQIQDNYEVQLVMKYETSVPVPVVIVDMPKEMPQLFNDETYPFMVTMTNKGLITAKDVQINFPQDDPEYEFVTNFTTMDLLAQQSIQFPVVMKRRAGLKSATSGGTCVSFAATIYGWQCGPDRQWGHSQNSFSFSGRICIGSPGPSTTGPEGTPWWNGWAFGNVPQRGGGGYYWYNPTLGIPTVGSSTAGCEPCLISLALNGIGCFPILGPMITNAAGILGCILSLADLEVTRMDLADCGMTGLGLAIDLGEIGCAYGLARSAMDCYENPPIFTKSPEGSKPTMPPILKQSILDLEYAVAAHGALDSLSAEIYGDWDWRAKASLKDFNVETDPFIKQNKPFYPTDITALELKMAGTDISSSDIRIFTTRWNNTINAWSLQVYSPTVDHPDMIDKVKMKKYIMKIDTVQNYAISRGYDNFMEMYNVALATTKEQVDAGRSSVCASVSINITQKVVMTREAFEGTLTIFNGHTTDDMKEIKLNLEIKDENGVLSNDLFQIDTKALSILTGIDGTGTLAAQGKGSATVLFIPEKGAAPTVPKSYSFGGSFSYLDPFTGVTVTKPLFPVTLDVNPSPDIYLHYFMQRDILGDDPLTVPIEPIVPAEFAVMVQNNGYGTAQGVRIESAQPKIVENKKGLAINFALIGSNLNGQPRQLGLTNIDFGNIAPKSAAIGQWWFTSDLLGHFVSYEAKVSHLDSRGNPDLSLISGATLHELIRSVDVYSGVEDGIHDFLVNEVQDAKELPDIIYLSNGGTLDVYPAPLESTTGSIASGNHEIELTVTPKQIGWNYIKFSDPGNGIYKIASVMREDGQVIPLENVWQTFVTLPDSKEPVYENMMHFLDVFAAANPQKYTIRFIAKDQNPPEIVSFENVPTSVVTIPVTSINVVFNKPIDPATFNYEDMTLRIQAGADVMDSTVKVTQIDPVTFKIDLTSKSIQNGYYVLTVQASQISSTTGTSGLTGKQATWTQYINVPAVSEFIGLPDNNIGAPMDFIMLRFNLPIDNTTLLPSRLTWKKNGTVVSVSVTITPMDVDGKLFQVSGLKAFLLDDAKYSLTVDLPNIATINGVNGILTQSVEWEIDQTPPSVSKITLNNDGGYDLQHITAIDIQLSEAVNGFGLPSIELWKDGTRQPLSQLTLTKVSGSEYRFTQFRLLTYYEGTYTLKVNMEGVTDISGNTASGIVEQSWAVYRTTPKAVTGLKITPDLGFSDNDALTSSGTVSAVMNVNEPDSRIQIYQNDKGNRTLLADTSNIKTGSLILPIKFTIVGNLILEAHCLDSYKNEAITELPVFIDDVALLASWKNVPQKALSIQPDSLVLEFFDKLLDDTKLKDYLKFARGGLSIGTSNITISKSSDKVFVFKGMNVAGNTEGNYSLSIDLTKFQKYSSGKPGISDLKAQWSIGGINQAPVANAGTNQTVDEAQLVTLDGSQSSDPNNDQLTYKWTAPSGITLSSTTSANPTFTAPYINVETQFTFGLVVNDGIVNSDPVTVKITVRNSSLVGLPNQETSLIRIYPNPTTGIVNIETGKGTGTKTGISVISSLGAEIYHKESVDATQFQVDLSNQSNGVYLLIINRANQQTIKKIVVLKK